MNTRRYRLSAEGVDVIARSTDIWSFGWNGQLCLLLHALHAYLHIPVSSANAMHIGQGTFRKPGRILTADAANQHRSMHQIDVQFPHVRVIEREGVCDVPSRQSRTVVGRVRRSPRIASEVATDVVNEQTGVFKPPATAGHGGIANDVSLSHKGPNPNMRRISEHLDRQAAGSPEKGGQ